MRLLRPLSLVALVALVFTPGCSRTPKDPILALLSELEVAAEARDAERFGQGVSAEFRTLDGMGKADALIELKRYFALYEKVEVEVYGVETEREGAEARVRCVVDFTGDARQVMGLQGFLPPDVTYRFEVEVAEEGGTWRVRSARWEVVPDEPTAPAP